jgi:hypothetical protein
MVRKLGFRAFLVNEIEFRLDTDERITNMAIALHCCQAGSYRVLARRFFFGPSRLSFLSNFERAEFSGTAHLNLGYPFIVPIGCQISRGRITKVEPVTAFS